MGSPETAEDSPNCDACLTLLLQFGHRSADLRGSLFERVRRLGGAGDDVTLPPYGPAGGSPAHYPPSGNAPDPGHRPPSTPLALAALIVCAAAFLLGPIPLLGAALGVVGIVLVVVVARRGLATRRTYVGAGAAALGILASVATTAALVGLAVYSPDSRDPEPTVAAEEADGSGVDPVEETTEPVDVEEDTTEAPLPATTPATTTEPEPTAEPAVVPAAPADPDSFEELDERTLAQIVKAPDDHIGRQVVVYGQITQLDAATGRCVVRVSISHAPQDDWYDYEHNTMGMAGDGEADCPVLEPFVADDEVKLWVTVGGSLSYETQIGGSTTVPAYYIDQAELL